MAGEEGGAGGAQVPKLGGFHLSCSRSRRGRREGQGSELRAEDRPRTSPCRPMGPPRGWLETQVAGHPQSYCFNRWGLRMCISTKFPGDADAAGLGTTL